MIRKERCEHLVHATLEITLNCELPPISDQLISADMRRAIVRKGAPEPKLLNHLMYIVGVDGSSTSVGFNTTVQTDGGIAFCVTNRPSDCSSWGKYDTETIRTTGSISTKRSIQCFSVTTRPHNPTSPTTEHMLRASLSGLSFSGPPSDLPVSHV